MTDTDPISITGIDGEEPIFNKKGSESLIDLDKLSHLVSYQGFIQQNLVYFRSKMKLTLVLGNLLSFAIFCILFFIKNTRYSGVHKIQPFPVKLADFKQDSKVVSVGTANDEMTKFSVKFEFKNQ